MERYKTRNFYYRNDLHKDPHAAPKEMQASKRCQIDGPVNRGTFKIMKKG